MSANVFSLHPALPTPRAPPPMGVGLDGVRLRLAEDGYVLMPGLCDAADLALIQGQLLALFAREAGHAEGNLMDMLGPDIGLRHALQPQLLKPHLYAPSLLLTRYFRAAQQLASQLLGVTAEFSFDHSILRRPGHHATTPWHQDEAHGHDAHFRREQISFWMPLQNVDEHSGCLRYIPGSQRGGLLPHRALGENPRNHALEVPSRLVREAEARAVPMPAGWCVLHGGRTLHASLPNVSERSWLSYVLVFHGPPIARTTALHLEWLRTTPTAAATRRRHWLWHGGAAVVAIRWCQRMLRSDGTTLLRRVHQRLRRAMRIGVRP